MEHSFKRLLRNITVMILILAASFFASLLIHNVLNTQALVPSVFILAVFLVSLLTDGYFYGIAAALTSMLVVNFAFTFPFFEFNFTIHENAVSALIMMVVAVVTSTLTTKLKRQEMLRAESEKEKMRANLLRAISHDLRTPLTTIYGTSSTLIENYEALEDVNKLQLLYGIKEDSQWLIRMVENLLSVTKFGNDNVKLIKSSVVLEELIDSALAKFQKRYPTQDVQLSIPEAFITVEADAILIEQVLVNLLENAVQHAVGMTCLQLCVREHADTVSFEVIDDGCGIEKEKLKQILVGRYTASNTSADSSKQFMGIGLSVCATIIKAHDGQLWAENGKNGGVCFGFSLQKDVMEDE